MWPVLKQNTDGAKDAHVTEDRGSYPLSLGGYVSITGPTGNRVSLCTREKYTFSE